MCKSNIIPQPGCLYCDMVKPSAQLFTCCPKYRLALYHHISCKKTYLAESRISNDRWQKVNMIVNMTHWIDFIRRRVPCQLRSLLNTLDSVAFNRENPPHCGTLGNHLLITWITNPPNYLNQPLWEINVTFRHFYIYFWADPFFSELPYLIITDPPK